MTHIEKLNLIASKFNPFAQDNDPDIVNLINELELTHLLENPFDFSNHILKMLHDFDQVDNIGQTLQ